MNTRTRRIVAAIEDLESPPAKSDQYVAKLAGMIQRNGLLQTVAFLEMKGARTLLTALRRTTWAALQEREAMPPDDFLIRSALATCDLETYLFLTELAIEVADWIDRFARAAAEAR